MKFSISQKIILIAAAAVVASSITILCISTILMRNLLTRTIHEDMLAMQSVVSRMKSQEEEQLLRILNDMSGYDENQCTQLAEEYVDNLHKITGYHFTIFKDDVRYMTTITDENGERIIGVRLENDYIENAVLNNGEVMLIRCESYGEPKMTALWSIKDNYGNVIGSWAISKPMSVQEAQENTILMIVVVCSVGVMLIFVFAAGFIGNRIAKPIRQTTDCAVQIAQGNYDVHFNIKGGNEVGLMVEALETMVVTLKEKIHEAQVANKAKSSFLSTISHEIRTPMNAILGITEIQLLNKDCTPDTSEAFDKIYASGDLLLSIINDLLDLSKIEAGRLELSENKYETASLVNDTIQLNIMRIGSKSIEFELQIDDNMPSYMIGDELRVKQILNNLLSNAFKYTLAGTVTLSICSKENINNNNEVILVIDVSDTGQGMTYEQVSKLFDEYSRFNQDANRTIEGTGLGMSITNNLINLMNGQISVKSKPGEGSVFTVLLPQKKCGDGILGAEVAQNLRQFKIRSRSQMKRVQITREPMPYGSVLIVDDVETNIYVAKGLLAPYGLMIDSANSGFGAIEKIKDGKTYDVVFMDYMMPNMDGIEATKRLREMGYSGSIVALTANAIAGQSEMFLENGFNDFLSKPIDIRNMNMVLNKLVRDKYAPEVIEQARQQATGSKPVSTDSRIHEIFVRDALKSLTVLEQLHEKDDFTSGENLRSYIVNIHGMKSALANIGQGDLSDTASKLETAARNSDYDVVSTQTREFLTSLRSIVEKYTPQPEPEAIQDEDVVLLREKLALIKAACEEYDEDKAEKILRELEDMTWSKSNKQMLSKIAECLLHSDFDEAAQLADNANEQ
jgi:signal transduction histidine kinase/DNA-binding response OmpR family regulator